MATTALHQQPTPERFFNAINAYEQTEAMKTAVELEIFTAIAEGNTTAATIAKRCEAAERGGIQKASRARNRAPWGAERETRLQSVRDPPSPAGCPYGVPEGAGNRMRGVLSGSASPAEVPGVSRA